MKKTIIQISLLIGLIGIMVLPQCRQIPKPASDTQDIVVYFSRSEPTEIVQVAVDRMVEKTDDIASTAIRELLKGPTESEKAQGLTTAIANGTVLNYVRIENGVATVDFNDKFDYQMGGSARVTAIRGQIEKTLFQFPGIKEVVITINFGERPAVLEP